MDDLKLHDPTKAFLYGLVIPGGGYFSLGSLIPGVLWGLVGAFLIGGAFYTQSTFPFACLALVNVLSARGARLRANELNRDVELEMQREHSYHLASIARNTQK